MTVTEEVLAQATALAGTLDETQQALLELQCRGAVSAYTARLRPGLTEEEYRQDLVDAATLVALAGLGWEDDRFQIQQFQAGDLTIRHSAEGRSAALEALDLQAARLMAPYLADAFHFKGV